MAWIWIQYWLSVALIPLALWLHHQVPPFRRYRTLPAELGVAPVLGVAVIAVRLLLQIAPVGHIAWEPPALEVSGLVWLLLVVIVFVAVEVALVILYFAWVGSFTGADAVPPQAARWLGPGYFLALLIESALIGGLLQAGGDAG